MSASFLNTFLPRAALQAVLKQGNLASVFTVSKASRFAFFFEQAAKRRYSRECKAGRLAYRGRAKRDALLTRVLAREIPMLMGFFAVLISLQPVFADPAPGASAASTFVTVSRLGESEQQAAARDGQLMSHRRATDPFGITIRGAFTGLPPVAERPSPTPAQPGAVNQKIAAPVNVPKLEQAVHVPTLEQAVQELAIGAVNVDSREILIGSRSIREGDLLVLESEGRQFVVWLQTVGVRGVLFCDTDLQKHILKPLGSGPKELPEDSVQGVSDIRNFLNTDARH